MDDSRPARLAALAGIVAAGAGLALADLVALAVDAAASPFVALGAAFVDVTPLWLKDLAVELFGTADKAVLLGTMAVVLAAGAALAGWLELRAAPWGRVLLGGVGGGLAVIVATRPTAVPLWVLPTAVGVVTAVLLLRALVSRVPPPTPTPTPTTTQAAEPAATADGAPRRAFLTWTGVAAGAAVVMLVASQAVQTSRRAAEAVREALRLPQPVRPALEVPAGADLRVSGAAPYITPNADFYRIDTALRIPVLTPDEWSLTVTGLVDEPFTLTWAELMELPLVEHHVTLACVSNPVGGELIGNALWLGYPVRDLIARARPQAGADMVLSRSVDGFTAGTPLEVLLAEDRESLLAVGMNGEALPPRHGFPARLVVPGLYGYVSATKWVTELKVTTFAADEGYWTPRGWSALGPVKLQSRIDVPRAGSLQAGQVVVAGVAWAQHTGIAAVEVRVDEGPWHPAELADTVGPDTWRQWRYAWDASPGDHTVAVRATDTDGQVQTEDVAPVAPDGATGWHTVAITVR